MEDRKRCCEEVPSRFSFQPCEGTSQVSERISARQMWVEALWHTGRRSSKRTGSIPQSSWWILSHDLWLEWTVHSGEWPDVKLAICGDSDHERSYTLCMSHSILMYKWWTAHEKLRKVRFRLIFWFFVKSLWYPTGREELRWATNEEFISLIVTWHEQGS